MTKMFEWVYSNYKCCMQVKDFLTFAEANHTAPPVIRFLKLHCIKVHTAVGLALIAGLSLPQLCATYL